MSRREKFYEAFDRTNWEPHMNIDEYLMRAPTQAQKQEVMR